ncbi:MAG: MAPEG family protein [Pseudomonadota bacterium]
MKSEILAPAAVLVVWTLIVLIWTTVMRFGSIARLDKDKLRSVSGHGIRGQDLEKILPNSANWPSHNYTHLLEQPTIFYAVVFILALSDNGDGMNLYVAWAYVGIRIIHSFWQSLVNKIPVRIGLFTVSTLCLLFLAVKALLAAF